MEYIQNPMYGDFSALSGFKDMLKFANWLVYFNVDGTMISKMQKYATFNNGFFDNNLFKEQLFDYFVEKQLIYCPICDLNIINNESNIYQHMRISKRHYKKFNYITKFNLNQRRMQKEFKYRLSLS